MTAGSGDAEKDNDVDAILALFGKLTEAINTGSGSLLREVIPPAALLDEAISCSGPNPLALSLGMVTSDIDGIMARLDKAGVSIEFDEVTMDEAADTHIAPGQDMGEGCTAVLEFTMRRVKLAYFVVGNGKVLEQSGTFLVIRIGESGSWYIVGPG